MIMSMLKPLIKMKISQSKGQGLHYIQVTKKAFCLGLIKTHF